MALRKIEEDVLLDLHCANHVIATGGSAVYSHAAMVRLKSNGVVVFLDADLATLESRVNDFDTRGLAKHPDQSFSELFHERFPLYRKYAGLTIRCGDLTQAEVSKKIVQELRNGAQRSAGSFDCGSDTD